MTVDEPFFAYIAPAPPLIPRLIEGYRRYKHFAGPGR